MYRFVICVDVEEQELPAAYAKLYDAMKQISSPQLEWESTDEAYGEDGQEIDPIVLQNARMMKLPLE